MALQDVTQRDAVISALEEFDQVGRDAFLARYRFGRARRYFIEYEGRLYDSKAVIGAAHLIQHGVLLRSTDFSGGEATVVPVLGRLGFSVSTGSSSPESLRDMLEEVLLLQTEWTHRKTEAMDRRGQLVRREIPEWLRTHFARLLQRATWPGQDLAVEGRDGTGPKTEIPWTRVYSQSRSPSATSGWYIVFLFSALGDRCYLTLCHGATRWDGVEFKPRPAREMLALMAWARQVLGASINLSESTQRISLEARRSRLGQSYEVGTVVAFEYGLDEIPEDDQLLQDAEALLPLLTRLYEAEISDPRVPGTAPPEVALVTEIAAEASGKRAGPLGGQGFRLTKPEQRAVELHAVSAATAHFASENWVVTDVSGKESYDLMCTRGEERLFVEVKGTMSLGDSVLLTRNEVALHSREYPNNCLSVVHSIELDRSGAAPIASGGVLEVTSPWYIEENDLQVIAYIYRRRHAAD